jgi:type II secretory pathway component GspD/PulD (secretin)
VTLSVENLDIKEVLGMLADSRELNLIYQGDVKGLVSLELHAVPFNDALRAAVAMAGYDVLRKGNIYFIRQPDGDEASRRVLNEIHTFHLNYAHPDHVLPVLGEILSPQGSVTSYGPLRSVVVEDRSDVIERAQQVIRQIDVPPRQVLIEAEIIEARLGHDVRYGIDWSLFFSHGQGSGSITAEGFASPAAVGNEGAFVVWGEGDFTASLESMESIDELNTLAAPRVLAIDGEEAEIQIGGQLGFSVVTTIDNTVIQSVEFLDTGTLLQITPTIAEDGQILLHIHPELADAVITAGLPSKTTTQVTTDVLITDGHTLLIGGLIQEREEKVRKGIPLLMNIPLLGKLFGRTTLTTQKSEIIVLITPRIVRPGEAVPYQGMGLITSRED